MALVFVSGSAEVKNIANAQVDALAILESHSSISVDLTADMIYVENRIVSFSQKKVGKRFHSQNKFKNKRKIKRTFT
jgi:hypothetical protein